MIAEMSAIEWIALWTKNHLLILNLLFLYYFLVNKIHMLILNLVFYIITLSKKFM